MYIKMLQLYPQNYEAIYIDQQSPSDSLPDWAGVPTVGVVIDVEAGSPTVLPNKFIALILELDGKKLLLL